MAFLRNPLAWYKRYVEKIYDTPRNPSAMIGSAAHLALQHFYAGIDKEGSIALGLEYSARCRILRSIRAKRRSKKARKAGAQNREANTCR